MAKIENTLQAEGHALASGFNKKNVDTMVVDKDGNIYMNVNVDQRCDDLDEKNIKNFVVKGKRTPKTEVKSPKKKVTE